MLSNYEKIVELVGRINFYFAKINYNPYLKPYALD